VYGCVRCDYCIAKSHGGAFGVSLLYVAQSEAIFLGIFENLRACVGGICEKAVPHGKKIEGDIAWVERAHLIVHCVKMDTVSCKQRSKGGILAVYEKSAHNIYRLHIGVGIYGEIQKPKFGHWQALAENGDLIPVLIGEAGIYKKIGQVKTSQRVKIKKPLLMKRFLGNIKP
jgi:hypothetical protein